MGKSLSIGGITSTAKKPLIAVPLLLTDETMIHDVLTDPRLLGADVLEWRIDAWREIQTLTDKLIGQIVRESVKPLILTWRTAAEGGQRVYQADDYRRVYLAGLHAQVAAIDVEIDLLTQQTDVLMRARAQNIPVIGSRHDWHFPDQLQSRLTSLIDQPVDVLKYAVAVEQVEQAQQLLACTKEASQLTDKPFITMAMGDAGQITRIQGIRYGSQLTFAQIGQASAPGQLTLEIIRDHFPVD